MKNLKKTCCFQGKRRRDVTAGVQIPAIGKRRVAYEMCTADFS